MNDQVKKALAELSTESLEDLASALRFASQRGRGVLYLVNGRGEKTSIMLPSVLVELELRRAEQSAIPF